MGKFISHHPLPNEREREILIILIEEAAEVQQRATKALRFGMGEIQPGQSFTNSTRLADEVGDFMGILDMAIRERLLTNRCINHARVLKERKLAKYMQTEPSPERNSDV